MQLRGLDMVVQQREGSRLELGLQGRHVVVTGGTGALGQAIVQLFLDAGAHVHVPSRSKSPRVELDSRVHFVGGVSLTDESDVEAFYAGIAPLWASVHVAGGFAMGPIAGISLEAFRAQIDVNLISSFLCLREAVRQMTNSAEGGRIVTVISRPALVPTAGMLAYTTSKGAVAAMTQAASEELRSSNIYVNAIAPSIIDTQANREAMPDADHSQWPSPSSLASTVGFLSSKANQSTSGALVPVYGKA